MEALCMSTLASDHHGQDIVQSFQHKAFGIY